MSIVRPFAVRIIADRFHRPFWSQLKGFDARNVWGMKLPETSSAVTVFTSSMHPFTHNGNDPRSLCWAKVGKIPPDRLIQFELRRGDTRLVA